MSFTHNTLDSKSRADLAWVRQQLEQADAVLIGAGAGLSAADGFEYSGKWFATHFADFVGVYGFTDAYSAGFYPFSTAEEKWGYWSRYIYHNRYGRQPGQTYADLLRMVESKEYFVLTTNVDHCFQRAGFDKHRLFYTQGDYGLFQCATPCHDATYDNAEQIQAMVSQQKNRRIPSELLPTCPRCGEAMDTNLRADGRFVQDAGWYAAAERYSAFVQAHGHSKIFLLELGVGANTPGIIKYPFWKLTASNPQARYASISLDAALPSQLSKQGRALPMDIRHGLQTLMQGGAA